MRPSRVRRGVLGQPRGSGAARICGCHETVGAKGFDVLLAFDNEDN